MLLQDTSERFRELFLLAFTKELILYSGGPELIELESEVVEEKEERREKIKEIIKGTVKPAFKPLPQPFKVQRPLRKLIIPKTRLPMRLQYIRPTPTEIKLDLGKLNPLIQDPAVQTIECHGPNKTVIVRTPAERKTKIVLTKDEIDRIIETFSEAAKIPVGEGIFRVAVGKLILSAIISEVIGSKFIIKKIAYSQTVGPPSSLQPTRAFMT